MKLAPHYEEWVRIRKDSNPKIEKAKYLKEFEDALSELDFKLPPKHIDLINNSNLNYVQNTLIYSEGSPAFHHFNISPGAELIHKAGRGFGPGIGCLNRFRNLWKWHDIDSNILDQYKNDKKWDTDLEDVKAKELNEFTSNGNEFDLFPMQFFDSVDMPETSDALRCALKKNRTTLFVLHPTTHEDNEKFAKIWDHLTELLIVPPSAKLVYGRDTNSIIKHSRVVYSANSAVSFNAMLEGKPAATYRITPWSEVLPLIDSAMHDLEKIKPVPEEDLKRFLSWYYNKFTLDLHSSDWKTKLEKIVEKSNNGKGFEGLFA